MPASNAESKPAVGARPEFVITRVFDAPCDLVFKPGRRRIGWRSGGGRKTSKSRLQNSN